MPQDDGWMAYLYCETCKVLRSASVVNALDTYKHDVVEFAQALTSPAMMEILEQLMQAQLVGHLHDAEGSATSSIMQSRREPTQVVAGGSAHRFRLAVAPQGCAADPVLPLRRW